MESELMKLVSEASPGVQEITYAALERIRELIPDAQEKVVTGYRSINFGTGPRMKDQFLALILHANHVNLQFFHGAALPDPRRLLEGTGKKMRHIKLKDAETIQAGDVADLVLAAAGKQGG